MIKIALVDDNPYIHQQVVDIIQTTLFTDINQGECRSFYSAEAFLSSAEIETLDLVLLDIEMAAISGLQLSDIMMEKYEHIPIIFLTSYDHYMGEAFGLNIHDYILKENIESELVVSIQKLLKQRNNQISQMLTLVTNLGEVEIVEEQIIFILFEYRKPTIYLKDLKLQVYRETLSSLFLKLTSSSFVKVNSGAIINIKYVEEIKKYEVLMKYYDLNITVSRRKFTNLINHHTGYHVKGEAL